MQDIKLSALRKKIVDMCGSRFEPKSLCWLENLRDGEQSESYYCPECANKMIGWLLGGKLPGKILANKYANHPDWKGLHESDLSYTNTRGTYETDGCEHCEVCGCQLSVILLEYGVESEIDHYEQVDVSQIGSKDYWHLLDVIDGICHVEAEWFPGAWMEPSEIEESRQLYYRVLEVIKKVLGQEGGTDIPGLLEDSLRQLEKKDK